MSIHIIARVARNRRDEPTDEEIEAITGKKVARNRRDEPTDEEIEAITGKKVASASATWAKLRDGSWGIRSTVEVRPGGSCLVERKDGTRSTVTVKRKIWSDGAVWLYAIETVVPASSSSTSRSTPSRSTPARKPGRKYECAECGEFVMPGTSCWETGALH